MIQAVIFDMDGVLVDSEPLWQQATIDSFQHIGISLSVKEAREIQGMRVDALVAYFYQRYRWDSPSQEDVQRLILQTIIALINEHGEPKPGALAALEFFSDRSVKVGLASSSPTSVIRAVVDRLAISNCFDIIHSAEHEPYGKPHPAVYLSAAEKLSTSPSACLAIEDSLPGLLSATSANMKCLCVPDPSLQGDPRLSWADAVIPSLADLDEALWGRLTDGWTPVVHPGPLETEIAGSDLREQILSEISRTLDAVDEIQLARLVEALLSSRRIFVTGKGRSGLQMQAFAMRLTQMDMAAHVVGEATAPAVGPGDCLLIGSGSGRTAALVEYADRARSAGADVCLLTASTTSPLLDKSEHRLIIPAPPAVAKLSDVQPVSIQPLGTLFETCLGIVLDMICLRLMEALDVTAEQMADRHANLE